ncbi:MAG: PDDEXK nuclease domain-containing protein, partial [Bacteroidota bacterium]
SERELEAKLIQNVRRFLIEIGSDFTFVGTQFRLVVDGDEFFIDLVLFHRRLRSLIAIELKTTKFTPEAAGKMQFYLTALDDLVRNEDENPSIGIIICKEKNRTVVEYTLRHMQSPMGVATYRVHGDLPENYQQYLPSPEEIAERLEIFRE